MKRAGHRCPARLVRKTPLNGGDSAHPRRKKATQKTMNVSARSARGTID